MVIICFFNKKQRQSFFISIKMNPFAKSPVIILLFIINVVQSPTTVAYPSPMVRISVNAIIRKRILTAVLADIMRLNKTFRLIGFNKDSKGVFIERKTIVHI